MLPQVYAKYLGKRFKLEKVIIQQVGSGRICLVYLRNMDGDKEVVPFNAISFVNGMEAK